MEKVDELIHQGGVSKMSLDAVLNGAIKDQLLRLKTLGFAETRLECQTKAYKMIV